MPPQAPPRSETGEGRFPAAAAVAAQPEESAAHSLGLSFAKLVRRAEAVSRACSDEIAMLGNDAMVAEAQRGIQQAEGLRKITFIAFVFVLLSFAASFFGMNLSQLNGTGLDLWVWFVASAAVLALSLLAWLMDGRRRRAVAAWARRRVAVSHLSGLEEAGITVDLTRVPEPKMR